MKRGRPRVYSDRTSTSFSCEKVVLEDFLELCWKEKTSLGEKLQTFMEQELKKEVGLTATPIAVAYNRDDVARANNNMQTTIISFFAHCSTTKEVFHRLRDDLTNVTPEDMPELDRRYRNFAQGWQQYKANVITR